MGFIFLHSSAVYFELLLVLQFLHIYYYYYFILVLFLFMFMNFFIYYFFVFFPLRAKIQTVIFLYWKDKGRWRRGRAQGGRVVLQECLLSKCMQIKSLLMHYFLESIHGATYPIHLSLLLKVRYVPNYNYLFQLCINQYLCFVEMQKIEKATARSFAKLGAGLELKENDTSNVLIKTIRYIDIYTRKNN